MNDHPLKRWRDATGTTLLVLAETVSVTKSTISRIESGNADPSLDLIRRLVEATGLRADDFLHSRKRETLAAGLAQPILARSAIPS